MSLLNRLRALFRRDEETKGEKRDPFSWDREHVHYCVESYFPCNDVGVACGLRLSTWVAPDLPWRLSGNRAGTMASPERDLGYSFSAAPVTCSKCRLWMEANLNRCVTCGVVCVYSYCGPCAERSLIESRYCRRCLAIPCRCVEKDSSK